MVRRTRSNPLKDLFSIATVLPWWACVGLAMLSFLIFHWLAGMEIQASRTSAGAIVPPILQNFVKGISTAAQFLLPFIFLAGAIASAVGRGLRTRIAPQDSQPNGGGGSHPTAYSTRGANLATDQPVFDEYAMWKAASSDSDSSPKIDSTRWSRELLSALEWKRFEQVCAALFECLGFVTKKATTGADGGVDILLFRPPEKRAVAIVQCKAWSSGKVGVAVARELRGVMASMRIAEGIVATSSTFSDDAREFASANHIDLMDGHRILQAIATLLEAQQASLLELATAGDYTSPTCPSCGVKMVRREAKAGGKPFWGCVNYPRCRSIINIAKA